MLLLIFCYAGWLLATYFHQQLGFIASTLIGAVLVTLHSSLNHEVLHGHPTKNARLNEALVLPALGLFFPYRRFKTLHIIHHNDDLLTDPFADPESYYLSEDQWRRLPAIAQRLLTFMNTLLGRMLLGPAHMVLFLMQRDAPLLLKGDREVRAAYLLHAFGVVLALSWVLAVAGMNFWHYLLIAYLGSSLLMVRTFAEHQSHVEGGGRTIIVEKSRLLGPLFLYNNLHIVHHRHPKVPWYELPKLYRTNREDFLKENDGYVFQGYAPIVRKYFFRPKEPVMHPLNHRI